MRVMLDTNILVSTIFFPSEQTRNIANELGEKHRIVLCDYVIEELQLGYRAQVSTLDGCFR